MPLPEVKTAVAQPTGNIVLSLPTIHCAGCMSAVERGLAKAEGVRSARVNLSLKRVVVDAKPGLTPDALIDVLAGIGYEAHELDPALLEDQQAKNEGRNLLMRLAVAGFAMMNVLLLSIAVWAGAEGTLRDMMHWFSAMIALPAIVFAAQPFFKNALSAIRAHRLNMDVPISLAILLASGMSLFETIESGPHTYFDAALSLTFFLLAGRYLDYSTRASARSAAQELAALEVPRAVKITDGNQAVVPVGNLVPNDVVLVSPGTRVPVDGVVIAGESEIDRAFLTGETVPVYAGPDLKINAGEINLTGPLTMRVTARARESSLQKMADLVALAETGRNKYTSLADRAAALYAPGVHILAALAFVGWLSISGDLRLSINIAIAVLIITCPCALGLAVPAVNTAASGRLYKNGVLLKNATALERLAEVDCVLFDKTGTLTLGTAQLNDPDSYPPKAFSLAAELAKNSAHPLARSLAQAAAKRKMPRPDAPLSDIKEIPGHGISGRWNAQEIRLGRASWVGAPEADKTSTYFKLAGQDPVAFTFNDDLRPGVVALVPALKKLGLEIHLVTGDSAAPASDIAARTGIDHVFASVGAEEKAALVKSLAAAGRKVLMVGDGLNDTGALAAAHVSISPASALEVARVASDIVILGRDFGVLATCIKTSRAARHRITENFALAALYNMIAIPVALLGFATPLIAALAMSASSITVTLNAWRLR